MIVALPQTAFNFFAAEQWASLRGELGTNAAPQDISRLIGERWNKSSEGERAPYVAMAQVGGGCDESVESAVPSVYWCLIA